MMPRQAAGSYKYCGAAAILPSVIPKLLYITKLVCLLCVLARFAHLASCELFDSRKAGAAFPYGASPGYALAVLNQWQFAFKDANNESTTFVN